MIDRQGVRARLDRRGTDASDLDCVNSDEDLVCEAGTGGGERERIPAAVLIALVARPDGPHVILTERAGHLRDHAAEISLPGGRLEPQDAGSPEAAALREAFEEIGLRGGQIEILGSLRPYDTISGFRVHPVVGWIEPPVTLRSDPLEVADVFEVPLAFLTDPAHHHRDSLVVEGITRSFYVLPYPGRYIWGATAGILVDFARHLGPAPPGDVGT